MQDARREDARREDARREDARREDARREDARREDARRAQKIEDARHHTNKAEDAVANTRRTKATIENTRLAVDSALAGRKLELAVEGARRQAAIDNFLWRKKSVFNDIGVAAFFVPLESWRQRLEQIDPCSSGAKLELESLRESVKSIRLKTAGSTATLLLIEISINHLIKLCTDVQNPQIT
jgi:hypothetical protein